MQAERDGQAFILISQDRAGKAPAQEGQLERVADACREKDERQRPSRRAYRQPAPAELLPKVVAQLCPLAELKAKLEGRLKGDQDTPDAQLPTMSQINILAKIYQTTIVQQGDEQGG
jgi:hypothetical protein